MEKADKFEYGYCLVCRCWEKVSDVLVYTIVYRGVALLRFVIIGSVHLLPLLVIQRIEIIEQDFKLISTLIGNVQRTRDR